MFCRSAAPQGTIRAESDEEMEVLRAELEAREYTVGLGLHLHATQFSVIADGQSAL